MDNTSISILEISVNIPRGSILNRSFHWLMIRRQDLYIQELNLKSRDDSSWIQERFFDLGYLKYDSSQGIFIQAGNHEMHPLALQDCSQVPENCLNAVQDWVGGHQQRKDGTHGG